LGTNAWNCFRKQRELVHEVELSVRVGQLGGFYSKLGVQQTLELVFHGLFFMTELFVGSKPCSRPILM
jgi:hypothetical protein